MKTLYCFAMLILLVLTSCEPPIDRESIPHPTLPHSEIPELPAKHYRLLFPGYKAFPYFEDLSTIYRTPPKPGEGC